MSEVEKDREERGRETGRENKCKDRADKERGSRGREGNTAAATVL